MDIKAYYAVFVPEEGKVSVWFPDVPGCQTWGESLERAFIMAMEALEGHLEAMADDGDPIPSPSSLAVAWEAVSMEFGQAGEVIPEGVLLQLVPAPDVESKRTRINVSFRRSTLTMIDQKADQLGMTRSGFLARAAAAYTAELI
jgi:predicted RNase H-like HicB family nuclease